MGAPENKDEDEDEDEDEEGVLDKDQVPATRPQSAAHSWRATHWHLRLRLCI